MLKKTITYTDYNGTERKEDFYFNLTQTEVYEMEMSVNGGLAEKLQKIIDAMDAPFIMKTFKDLIAKSYGVKSEDGKRFIKSPELSEAFFQTEAYNKLFQEIVTDAKAAADFVNGILPSNAAKSVATTA